MKRTKSMMYGATVLLLAIGSATASASTLYAVDEDRDGRIDRELLLEQSDSLA